MTDFGLIQHHHRGQWICTKVARQRKGVLDFQGWKIEEENIPQKRMEEFSSLIFIFKLFYVRTRKMHRLLNPCIWNKNANFIDKSDPLANLSIPHSVQLSQKNLVASSIYGWRPLPHFQIPVGAYYYIIC